MSEPPFDRDAHLARRNRDLTRRVAGLEAHRQRLELTAGLLALAAGRGHESLSDALLDLAERVAAESLAGPQEPREARGAAVSGERLLALLGQVI